VPEFDGVAQISWALDNTLVRRADGTLAGWGPNSGLLLATGDDLPRDDYVPIDLGAPVLDFAPGGGHACALAEGGDVFCWGIGQFQQLGQGDPVNSMTPIQVHGLPVVVALAATADATFALDKNGGVWCWGADWDCPDSDGTPRLIELPGLLRATSNQDP